MRRALALFALAACVDAGESSSSLNHEHVVAVRAQPAAIEPGGVATLDGLLAHADAPTTDEQPIVMTAKSPIALFTAVHFEFDHWQIECPAVAEPTPLVVEMRFASGEVATKIVVLGDTHANPAAPAIGVPDPVPLHEDVALGDAEWFTSCGTLRGTTLRVDEPCEGELVGVVRDLGGGVAWTVVPLHAR